MCIIGLSSFPLKGAPCISSASWGLSQSVCPSLGEIPQITPHPLVLTVWLAGGTEQAARGTAEIQAQVGGSWDHVCWSVCRCSPSFPPSSLAPPPCCPLITTGQPRAEARGPQPSHMSSTLGRSHPPDSSLSSSTRTSREGSNLHTLGPDPGPPHHYFWGSRPGKADPRSSLRINILSDIYCKI